MKPFRAKAKEGAVVDTFYIFCGEYKKQRSKDKYSYILVYKCPHKIKQTNLIRKQQRKRRTGNEAKCISASPERISVRNVLV